MKKEYIKPEMELTLIETELPMAMSIGDREATEGDGLSRGRRGSWGDLWNGSEE